MTPDGSVRVDDPAGDRARFAQLQAGFADQFRDVFDDASAPRTVLVVPSLSLDQEVLSKISGVLHYEERMLCLLLLLRMPRTRVVFVSSQPIPDAIVDYYLHHLTGIPRDHARRRLTMLSCYDSGARPLTAKILNRPRLLDRIRQLLSGPALSHMSCFNVTELERRLAVQLDLPVYGCDPELLPIGSKSGSRAVFREAGLEIADGFEDLGDGHQVAEALAALRQRDPALQRAVVKLNDGFSGEGNAVLDFRGAPESGLTGWVRERLPRLGFAARDMTWDGFEEKIRAMGGIVEAFIEGDAKRSPSVQYRVDPLGRLGTISTHDQVTGGPDGQVFLGCRFPADPSYRQEIQSAGHRAAELLRQRGVLGRFGIDFISVPDGAGWRHYAVEINLRKGGTTHPFQMLEFLTDGSYDGATGEFRTRSGRPCVYRASDNVEAPAYCGLTPEDLVEIAVENDLHYHHADQSGVVFHLIGTLSEFGKLGMVCVAETDAEAAALYDRTVAILDREGAKARRG